MTPNSCRSCQFHKQAECNNGNGRCTSPESRWHNIVTGPQGLCDSYVGKPTEPTTWWPELQPSAQPEAVQP